MRQYLFLSYYAGEGSAPTAPIVEMGLFNTITESIFGTPDPNAWRPLPLSTFFSEGWNEAWVPSPEERFGKHTPSRLDQCHGR